MKHLTFLTLIVLFFQLSLYAQPNVQDLIRLTAIGAPWDVVIEGNVLDIKSVGTKPDGSYFLLFPSKDELNISLYIEPAAKCKTSEQCRDFVLNAGNPAWGKFESLTKSKFGDFSYFEFFRPEVQGRPLKMQDMYAQYVDKGYWVDLHVSKVLYKKEDKALFEKLLNSVKFIPKSLPTDFDKIIEPVKKVAENWLGVWGAKKCKESYGSLTSISREAIKENQWVEYCTAAHQNLGSVKSRNLIAITTTRSLPGKPGIAGAAFRFQSEFENRNTVEFVSLTREKDSRWTVSNYLAQ
jgi:hypothetical protein